MTKENKTKQEVILETDIGINQKELAYSENLGMDISQSRIFVIEPLRKKDRQKLTESNLKVIQAEIKNIKKKYPTKKVTFLVQFKKNMKKTIEQIDLAMRCGMFDGSDGVCLYETSPEQNIKNFSEELSEFLKVIGDIEKNMVLEIESNVVREKLLIALKKGIKNFILISGAYNDLSLWAQLVMKIIREKGTAIVVLTKRIHPTTKKAYMDKAVSVGASIVVHGMEFGGGKKKKVKPKEILFFDGRDAVYKNKDKLPSNSIISTNKKIKELIEDKSIKRQKKYEISRVCALGDGKTFCRANIRKVIFET